MRPVPFSPGRADCPTSPNSAVPDPLPDSKTTSTKQLYEFFAGQGFTRKEGAVLMSAHTFGRTFQV